MTTSQAFPRLRQATQADWKIRIVGAAGASDSRYEATLARLKSRSLEELDERKHFGNDEQLTVFLRALRSDRQWILETFRQLKTRGYENVYVTLSTEEMRDHWNGAEDVDRAASLPSHLNPRRTIMSTKTPPAPETVSSAKRTLKEWLTALEEAGLLKTGATTRILANRKLRKVSLPSSIDDE
jgi:hypothetical protein